MVAGLDFEAIKKMLVNPIDRQYKNALPSKWDSNLR